MFANFWAAFPWDLPGDQEPPEDLTGYGKSDEDCNDEELAVKSKTMSDTVVKIKRWLSYRRRADGGASPFTKWLSQLRRVEERAPKRLAPYQVYMQVEENNDEINRIFKERYPEQVGKNNTIKYRGKIARELFAAESEDTQEEYKEKGEEEYAEALEDFKKGDDADVETEQDPLIQQEARTRLAVTIQPLIDAIRAITGSQVLLVTGAVVEGKFDIRTLHAKTGGPQGLDFTTWDPRGYKLVLDQWMRYLIAASQDPDASGPRKPKDPPPAPESAPAAAAAEDSGASSSSPDNAPTLPSPSAPAAPSSTPSNPPQEPAAPSSTPSNPPQEPAAPSSTPSNPPQEPAAPSSTPSNPPPEPSTPAAPPEASTVPPTTTGDEPPTTGDEPPTTGDEPPTTTGDEDEWDEEEEEEEEDPLHGISDVGSPLRRSLKGLKPKELELRIAILRMSSPLELRRENNIAMAHERLEQLGLKSQMKTLMNDIRSGSKRKATGDDDARGRKRSRREEGDDDDYSDDGDEGSDGGGGGNAQGDESAAKDAGPKDVRRTTRRGAGKKRMDAGSGKNGAWATQSRELLLKEDDGAKWEAGGEKWEGMVSKWWANEEAASFTGPAKGVGTKVRPKQVGAWIKRGRTGGPEPAIGDVSAFSVGWWVWWVEINPKWRKRVEGGRRLARDTTAGDWTELQSQTGPNGLLNALICLRWWKDATRGESDDWNEALEDVSWVLDKMAHGMEAIPRRGYGGGISWANQYCGAGSGRGGGGRGSGTERVPDAAQREEVRVEAKARLEALLEEPAGGGREEAGGGPKNSYRRCGMKPASNDGRVDAVARTSM
ncbi:hypothetical protein R3P38DRAFT_2784329 [Favolaschia claudopus]|uniref:Uncharacterized protein n=1 Tax=Favolaschia claudopus TaxID=2862362 RepID=A0AAW0AY95_9AGAR